MSIAYLLCLTAGIGVAITVARMIEHVRFAADAWYYGKVTVSDLDRFGVLVACVYGLCLTTFLFALRSGNIWESPGKTLALLFAFMCLLNWGLEAFAGAVTSYRFNLETPSELVPSRGLADARGYIFGIWYRSFAPSVGYVAALPLLAFVLFKTRGQRMTWRAVWIGFLVFSLLMIAYIYFHVSSLLPAYLRLWFFECAIGVPLTLLAFALLISVFHRHRPDWWTVVTALPLLLAWGIGIVSKMMAT